MSYKIKAFNVTKMIDPLTFLDNNIKSGVYTGRNMNVIYFYIEMIGDPTTLTTSGQCSRHFGPSYSIKNDIASLHPFISNVHIRQKSICKCSGSIGYKAYACIVHGPKFLSPSIKRNMDKFNTLHGEEPNEFPREWNSQPPAAHFKSSIYPTNTIPVVSVIMGILNWYAIDNGDV